MSNKNNKKSNKDLDPIPISNRSKYLKYFKRALVVLFVLFLGVWGFFQVREYIVLNEIDRNVQEAREYWEKMYEEKYELIMEDSIGGQTPYETLEMFIESVRSKNYEQASQYFVVEKKEEELDSLETAPRENIVNYINRLENELDNDGDYTSDKTLFVLDSDLLVHMVKYPTGVWKIKRL